MSVVGTQGVFALGEQSAKGTFVSAQASFFQHMAMDINLGPQQAQSVFPLEVSGIITPTGAYKGMAFAGGGATFNPRLQGMFGMILKGALGQAVASVDGLYSETNITAATSGAGSDGTRALLAAGESLTGLTIPIPTAADRRVLVVYSSFGSALTGTLTVTDGTNPENFALSAVTGPGVYFIRGTVVQSGNVTTITTPAIGGLTNGTVRYAVGSIYDASPGTVREHQFRINPTDSVAMPWFTARVVTPGPTAGTELGFEGRDLRMAGLMLQFPQNGIVTARADFQGLSYQLVNDPYNNTSPNWDNGWQAAQTYESVPISCVVEGGIVIPGYSAAKVPMTNLRVQFSTNLTNPQQEMVIGSYFPDDAVPLYKALTIQATVKWNDSELVRRIYNNSLTNANWSPVVFESPFFAKAASPGNISATLPNQWNLRMYAPRVTWTVPQMPALAGGEMVMMQVIGQAIQPATGDYCDFRLTNTSANY